MNDKQQNGRISVIARRLAHVPAGTIENSPAFQGLLPKRLAGDSERSHAKEKCAR
jgi:hypothetical protein